MAKAKPAAEPEAPEPESPEKRKARVEKLKLMIQQASSPHGDGLQAAWRVCALIRKHGLDIVDPVLIDELYEENHKLKAELEAAKEGWVSDDDVDDVFPPIHAPSQQHYSTSTILSTQAMPHIPHTPGPPSSGFGPNFFSRFNSPQPPTPPTPPVPPPPVVPAGVPLNAQMPHPVIVPQSKFVSKCKHCHRVIPMGEPIKWQKGVGQWCPATSCHDDWLANQQRAASFSPNIP